MFIVRSDNSRNYGCLYQVFLAQIVIEILLYCVLPIVCRIQKVYSVKRGFVGCVNVCCVHSHFNAMLSFKNHQSLIFQFAYSWKWDIICLTTDYSEKNLMVIINFNCYFTVNNLLFNSNRTQSA